MSLLKAEHKTTLLSVARESIDLGVRERRQLTVSLAEYPADLQHPGCCFVTLEHRQRLRGCIGSLEPRRALVEDVVAHAYGAAFNDPRFPALSAGELTDLSIEISVLGPHEAIKCSCESELLEQLVPGRDGVVLRDAHYHATFLPSVWEQLPDAREFLRQLKYKAGMSDDYWSDSLQVFRYRTESFAENE